MMNTFDALARTVATGLPRRQILRGMVGAGVGAALATIGRSTELLADDERRERHSKTVAAVALVVHLPDGHRPVLTLFDRRVGRVSYKGQHLSFVPQMSDVTQAVELSVYTGPTTSSTLLKRVTLPVYGRRRFDAPPTSLGFPEEQNIGVAALLHDDMPILSTDNPDLDCTVWCCFGGELSGQACCCSASDPSCGSCCDGGHCPACS